MLLIQYARQIVCNGQNCIRFKGLLYTVEFQIIVKTK